MFNELLTISETAKLLGISTSTLRRLEENGFVKNYGLKVIYTPGGQRRYILDEVQSLYNNQGFSSNMGYGKKPALLIRDLTIGFTKSYSQLAVTFDKEMERVVSLVNLANKNQIPVVFSYTVYDPNIKASELWARKFSYIQMLYEGSSWLNLHPDIKDKHFDLINKTVYVSDLFDQKIVQFLRDRDVDTLIPIGVTTSGSIRATTVDAVQNGFHVLIPKDAVCDRTLALHTLSLVDMNARYADIVTTEEVIKYINELAK